MAENYVEILVKSRDDAAPDLDRLKAKLEELSHETATARAQVDDADAAAKLDRMRAKLLDLDHRTANPKIRMSGALRAEAEIHALEASLDRLKRKEDEVLVKSGTQGLLSRIMLGDGGSGGSGGILGRLKDLNIPDFVPLLGGSGGPGGLAAVTAAAGALLTEVVGLASGFAAAGAGAAAFGILAAPAVKKVEAAWTGLHGAQDKYQKALALYNADPTKAHAKSLHDAQVQLDLMNESIKKMPAAERGALSGVQELVSTLGRMSRDFEPQAFRVFSDFLKIANNLLPALTPFAMTFADALDGLAKQAVKFTASSGFKDWVAQFHSLEGPAITAIGEGIGKVAVSIGKLLTVMSAKDDVNAINIAFTVLAGTITAVGATVKGFMATWDFLSHDFRTVRHNLADTGHDWAGTFDRMRHDVADFAHNVAAHFDEIRANLHRWADDVGNVVSRVVAWFKALPGRILAAMASLPGQLREFGVRVVEGFVRGIESRLGDIRGIAERMVNELGHKVLHLLGIGSPSKVAHWWGEMIAQGLADGIHGNAWRASAAAAGMAGGVSSSLSNLASIPGWGRLAGGPGGGALQLQVTGGGSGLDQMFMTWLKNNVRAAGGDPRMFNKKVAFL